MNKKIIIIAAVALCIILAFIAYFWFKEDYNNKLEITVKTNGGVPYRWEYEIENGDIVKYVNTYVVEDKNTEEMVGAPVYYNYVFEGKKSGKTKIILRYVSVVDNKVEKEQVYNVNVSRRKGISLVAD